MRIAANMGAPPTINLFREVMLVAGLIKISFLLLPVLAFCLFFRAAYSLFLYACTQNGGVRFRLRGHFRFFIRDYVCIFLHLLPVYLILICSGSFFYGLR